MVTGISSKEQIKNLAWQVDSSSYNELSYDALRACKPLAKKSIKKINNLPHSPDLAPASFGVIQNLKNAPKRGRSVGIPDI